MRSVSQHLIVAGGNLSSGDRLTNGASDRSPTQACMYCRVHLFKDPGPVLSVCLQPAHSLLALGSSIRIRLVATLDDPLHV